MWFAYLFFGLWLLLIIVAIPWVLIPIGTVILWEMGIHSGRYKL